MNAIALIPLCLVATILQDAPQIQVPVAGQSIAQQEEKPPVDLQAVDVEPKLIKTGEVVYPPEALKAGQEGVVYVKMWVTAKGEPKEVEILKSENPVFNQSALNAAKEYRFTPAKIKGKPVAVWVTIPFKYKLMEKKDAEKKEAKPK